MVETLFVASDGAELATEVVGSGVPVVFLHANVCDRRMWQAQFDTVAATHKAIAYDRRGFGETRAKPRQFSALADLMAVLDATTDGEPAILVGSSLGGRIALDAALRYRSRVRGIVVIAPNVTGAPAAVYPAGIDALMARSGEAEASGDLDAVNAMKARLFLDGPLAAEGRVTGAVRNLFLDMSGIALRSPPFGSEVDAPPFYDRLAEISVPTLVLWGDLDFPHLQDRCRYIAATIPHATAQAIPGTAHLPSLENPAAVTPHLTAFLAKHAA